MEMFNPRKHVFHDLRPYICTFPQCDLMMFADRHAWLNMSCKSIVYIGSVNSAPRHLTNQSTSLNRISENSTHRKLTEDQIKALLQVSCKPVDCVPAIECPFCLDWEKT